MNKRGRPPLPPERRRHVRITVNVTDTVADWAYLYMRSERETSLSEALAKLMERLAQRDLDIGALVDARIQTH